MIQPQDIFNIRFYAKQKFNGSYRGMHYRIEKTAKDEETQLLVTTWPGPYNFDTTDDSLKESASFPFSNDGLADICRYLNEFHKKNYS